MNTVFKCRFADTEAGGVDLQCVWIEIVVEYDGCRWLLVPSLCRGRETASGAATPSGPRVRRALGRRESAGQRVQDAGRVQSKALGGCALALARSVCERFTFPLSCRV